MTEPREPHWCEKHPDRVATLVLRSGAYACDSCRPPRSWAMPTIPDDVKAVSDSKGRIWWPVSSGNRDLWFYEGYNGSWPIYTLMGERGPLTEVVDSE